MYQLNNQIIVSGRGITAELMAMCIHQLGIPCILVGSSVNYDSISHRTVAIWQHGLDILKRIGIDVNSFENSYPIVRICIVDEHGSDTYFFPKQAKLKHKLFGQSVNLGILIKAVRQYNNQNVKHITQESIGWLGPGKIHLNSGQIISGKLIIVAEGQNSLTASQAGIVPINFHKGLAATIIQVQHKVPHSGTSFEFHKLPGPLAFVPLQEYHSAIVWIHDQNKSYSSDNQQLIKQINANSFQRMQVEQIIDQPKTIDLYSSQVLSLRASRLCLIGEAAHKLPPIGAQGLNLNLRDIDYLRQLLQNVKEYNDDWGNSRLLSKYNSNRLKDSLGISMAVHLASNSIRYSNSLGGLPGKARRFAQHQLVQYLPNLTSKLMRYAIYGF